MCAAAAPTHRPPVVRRPTPDPRTPARPALALRAPPDLFLQVTAPWTTCLQPSAPDRCPPALVLGLPCPIASFTPLDCTPMLQAFNCYVYRENLKKRVKAGCPRALHARSKELEREEKKSKKRKAARALAAPARPRPLPRPSKQKKRTADGLVVRDGQCEGTCKDGKRCRVGPGAFACAKPLNLGSEACSKRAASAGSGKAPGARPSRPDPRLLPPKMTGFVLQARVSARTTTRPSSLACNVQPPSGMANVAVCSAGRPTSTRSPCATAKSTASTT